MRYSVQLPRIVFLSVIAICLSGPPLSAQERPPMGTPDRPVDETAKAPPETTQPAALDASKPVELIKSEREPQMAAPISDNVALPAKEPPLAREK